MASPEDVEVARIATAQRGLILRQQIGYLPMRVTWNHL